MYVSVFVSVCVTYIHKLPHNLAALNNTYIYYLTISMGLES